MPRANSIAILLIATKIFSTTSSAGTEALNPIILEHFSKLGCNAYFCNVEEAAAFSKASSHEPSLFQSSTVRGSSDVTLARSRIGIFVDTNCPEGLHFLRKYNQLLNSSYSWLLRSDRPDDVLDELRSSRLNVDSDLTIIARHRLDDADATAPNDDFILTKVYRKHDSMPIETTDVEMWRNGRAYSVGLRTDRSDLGQLLFKGSVWLPTMKINEQSYEELMDPAFAVNVDVRWRYGITLFSAICKNYLNCRVQLIQAGCNDENNMTSCNGSDGIVDVVRRGIADFGVVPVTWDHHQTDIDYSLPVLTVKLKFLFLQPKMVSSCFALLRPLSPEIWILLGVLLALSALAFKIVSPYDDTSQHNDGWVGSSFLVISALAQQGVPDNTYKLTTRIIYVSILGVTFFVYVYYNTALLNGLLLPPPQSIKLAEDLFDSHLTVGLDDSMLIRERLGNNLDQGLFEKANTKTSADSFLPAAEGVRKIVREPFAIFGGELELHEQLWLSRMTFAETCSVGIVDDIRLPKQASFLLPHNSPYKELLRRGIIRSRERGAMARQKTNWLPDMPECLWKTDAVQFGFESLAVAYVIVGFGMIAGLVVLVGERFIKGRKVHTDHNNLLKDNKKMS